jgi:hypothetical protein
MTVVDARLYCRCFNPERGRCYRLATREDGRCDDCRVCSCSEIRLALPHLFPEPDPDCCLHSPRGLLDPVLAELIPIGSPPPDRDPPF